MNVFFKRLKIQNKCSFTTECSNKTYGVKCSKGCSQHCGGKDKACNNINGSCVYGCVDGFEGELCDSSKALINMLKYKSYLDLVKCKN